MAKTMAVIDGGIVTNMIWCSDMQPETDTWKNPADRPVGIGDTYRGGKWYRDGVEILTPLEEAMAQIVAYEAALSKIETAAAPTTPFYAVPGASISDRANAVVANIHDMKAALALLDVQPEVT